jgi:hypothetical protein
MAAIYNDPQHWRNRANGSALIFAAIVAMVAAKKKARFVRGTPSIAAVLTLTNRPTAGD